MLRYRCGGIHMSKIDYREFEKRYDKLKKNNLPKSFWDEERQTLEYVYYDSKLDSFSKSFASEDDEFDRRLHVEKNLTDALADIAFTGFYYPYTCKYFTLPRVDDDEPRKWKIELGHTHSHSFEHVVSSLYDFPESFKIEDDELEFYSKQELVYLRRVQKYLLFLEIKDLESPKVKVDRYRNKRQKKYGYSYIYSFSNESIQDFLGDKRNFYVRDYYEGFKEEKYKKDFFALFVDKEDNFKLYVEITSKEEKLYKDIKDNFKDDNLHDDDKVIVTYFKVLEKF